MQYKICIVFFFIALNSVGQEKTITIINAETKAPIEGVKIDLSDGTTATTNSDGSVKLPGDEKATLSYIGFQSLNIDADTITSPILLKPEAYELEGITLKSGHIRRRTMRVLPKQGLRALNPKNYGNGATVSNNVEIATFIPFQLAKKDAFVSKVYFEPTDYMVRNADGSTTNHKGAKYAPFKANLYYADVKDHKPLKPVFEKDFEIRLSEGERFAVLILDENQKFPFPEDGLCVVVKGYGKEYYEQLGYDQPPALQLIDVGAKNKFWQFMKFYYQGEDARWKTEYNFAVRNEIFKFDIEIEY